MTSWVKFLSFLDKKAEDFGAQYKAFAVFGLINYPLGYFVLYFIGTQESSLMRAVAFVLCIPLLLTKYWPIRAKKYLNLYWFSTLLFCFPTFGVYMLLENHFSTAWLMNIPLGIFMLVLLVDWVIFYRSSIPWDFIGLASVPHKWTRLDYPTKSWGNFSLFIFSYSIFTP